MSIQLLRIAHFRNIHFADIHCIPRFNLFYGDNAAGKTTLIEAIYYLSVGKSFQTHSHDVLIQNQENAFVLFAHLSNDTSLGLQRYRDGSRQIKMNETAISAFAELAVHLPVKLIDANSQRIITEGPRARRAFLDWGLFHTNATFWSDWRQFQKLLVQRNAALKARLPKLELQSWNGDFVRLAEQIDLARKNYLVDFIEFFIKMGDLLFDPTQKIDIKYYPGWEENFSLQACLDKNLNREYQISHTLSGPHRADLRFLVNDAPVEIFFSQGQQKLISYVLHLAQGLHFQSIKNQSPIYLIDDLPSELDLKNQEKMIRALANMDAQVFLTGIKAEDLSKIILLDHSSKMFHVEHGNIIPEQIKCFT